MDEQTDRYLEGKREGRMLMERMERRKLQRTHRGSVASAVIPALLARGGTEFKASLDNILWLCLKRLGVGGELKRWLSSSQEHSLPLQRTGFGSQHPPLTAHNFLKLQLQRIQHPLLASTGTAHMRRTYIHEGEHTHHKTKISKSLVKGDRGQGLV